MGIFDFLSSTQRTSNGGFEPFEFHSSSHQRFENGIPKLDRQICGRSFRVEKNINGCSGYQLQSGFGFVVFAINDDTGAPQFSPKPMKVIEQSAGRVLLRGYPTKALSPFGWVDFDLSDYGFEVFYENSIVVKCILYMYDRNVKIEYYK